jgi:hypothetical protein
MLCSAAGGAGLAARQGAESPACPIAAERHSDARAPPAAAKTWVCPGRARTGSDYHHSSAVSGSCPICQAERPALGAAAVARPRAGEGPVADAQAPFAEAPGGLPARWVRRRAARRPNSVPNCPLLPPSVAVLQTCLDSRCLAAAPPGRHSGPAPGRGTRRWRLRCSRETSSTLSCGATPFIPDAASIPLNAGEGPTLPRVAADSTTCALV